MSDKPDHKGLPTPSCLVYDAASRYFANLPEEDQRYRYPMNGLPNLSPRQYTPEEEEFSRRSCLGNVRE